MFFIGSLTAKSSYENLMAVAKVAVIKLPARVVCNTVFVNRNIVLLFGRVSKRHDVNFFFSQRLVGFFLHLIEGSTDACCSTYLQTIVVT